MFIKAEMSAVATAVNTDKDDAVGTSPRINEMYLVLTFNETLGRNFGIMNDVAQLSFEWVVTEFYSNQDVLMLRMNDVDLYSVEIWQ